MQCPDCGYEWDEVNESISVCPACGTDPNDPNSRPDVTDHPMVVDALAELADIRREEAEHYLPPFGRPQLRVRRVVRDPASKVIN